MKLNLDPKEFLALYNVLHALSYGHGPAKSGSEDATLLEVLNRMRACIISAISKGVPGTDADALMDLWQEKQNEKIDNLQAQNELLKAQVSDPDFLVPERGEFEEEGRTYPRRAPPQPVMPRPGKYKANRR